jgi:hypothetical protein
MVEQKLTLAELHRTAEYRDLLDNEKGFVDAYVESDGDATEAVLAAYNCRTARSARAFAYQVLARPRVLDAIGVWKSEIPSLQKTFLERLWKLINKRHISPLLQLKAMYLYAEVQGWRKGKMFTADPPPRQLHHLASCKQPVDILAQFSHPDNG